MISLLQGMQGMGGGPEMRMARDLALIAPEIAVLLTAVGALVFEMLRLPKVALPFTVVGLLAATALALPLLGTETTAFMDTFRVGPLGVWAKLALLPATALCALLARAEVRGTDREGTVYALLSFTALGALALAGAGDVMFLVLGVLLSSLGSFALVAYPRDERSTEAAMKYFVFGSVTGAVMIFGLTHWFGATSSTLLSELGRLEGAPLAAAFGLVAVAAGLGYKAAIAPFHFWAPDAYDGAPVSVAAFLSVVPKVGALFGLAQVARDLPAGTGWPLVLAALAALSMTYGNLAALAQENVVRLLAYSSIAQSGYFLLGVVAVGQSDLAVPALVVFAAAYAAMNLGAFAVVVRTGRRLGDLAGLGYESPWTGAAMVVFLISLVGIPPLAGFFGKLLLFGAAIDAGFVWLAVVGILNSVLSLGVYLRVVVPMYRRQKLVAARPAPVARGVQAAALALTLGIGLLAQIFFGGGG
ncbi:NADH dehydrogenase (quinone) [Rubrobacter xylanophilus DSM 9941]|uniref:NADH-quinone oxidoreductase subunit N n=1 Tax=Rubrobacter xylanophilus (strain DSM 9941 / JCM 11954 / NBRC 16129 / PRD-1) TaxID=266117 RepID=Q1AZS6_RUBXD|nr:NADH-quinone oxidoreductase subunit N [Rubrobacter xylanophilus]ABG03102.1 NADH dehydrogenase (quinone) [Rubrobacter xylanophilus DSM 9941]